MGANGSVDAVSINRKESLHVRSRRVECRWGDMQGTEGEHKEYGERTGKGHGLGEGRGEKVNGGNRRKEVKQ